MFDFANPDSSPATRGQKIDGADERSVSATSSNFLQNLFEPST